MVSKALLTTALVGFNICHAENLGSPIPFEGVTGIINPPAPMRTSENRLGAVTNGATFDITLSLADMRINIGGSSVLLLPKSECGIRYKAFPFAVECSLDMGFDIPNIGKVLENQQGPVVVSSYLGLVLNLRKEASKSVVALDFKYGLKTPKLDFDLRWLEAFGLNGIVNAQQFPPNGGTVTLAKVNVPDLKRVCLLDKLPLLAAPLAVANPNIAVVAKAIDKVGGLTGTDVCAEFPGLTFDTVGAQVKVLVKLHFLDETMMTDLGPNAKNIVVGLRKQFLNRTTPYIYTADIGKMLFDRNRQKGGRRALLALDGSLTSDGTFRLGRRATVSEDGDRAFAGEGVPSSPSTAVIVAGASSAFVVLVAAVAIVARKRSTAQAQQKHSAQTAHVIQAYAI